MIVVMYVLYAAEERWGRRIDVRLEEVEDINFNISNFIFFGKL